MPGNRQAKTRIRTGKRRFLLFKCQLPTCCNFITSFGVYNKKYCYSHQCRELQLKPEFKHLVKNKDDNILVEKK